MSAGSDGKAALHIEHALSLTERARQVLLQLRDGEVDAHDTYLAVSLLDDATGFARHAHDITVAGKAVVA